MSRQTVGHSWHFTTVTCGSSEIWIRNRGTGCEQLGQITTRFNENAIEAVCAVCSVTCLGLPLAGAGPKSRSGLLGVGPFSLLTVGLLVPE